MNFYIGSSCSGEIADTFTSSPGGCQCTDSENSQVSANPLRVVVDCGAGDAASTGTTALITSGCSSAATSSSGDNTVKTQTTIVASTLATFIFVGLLCLFGLWSCHKMNDSSVGVTNFSDHNRSVNGVLPRAATTPIQAMIYDPEEGDLELPHVTRIEVVDPNAPPEDVVFVEPQFVQFQSFDGSRNVGLEDGETKRDDATTTNDNTSLDELPPNRRYRSNKQRAGKNHNRANVQAWQDTSSILSPPQSAPPLQQRSSRSLLQASVTRHSASHNSLRVNSVSTDGSDNNSAGVARIIGRGGRVQQRISVDIDESDDDGDEEV